LQHTGKNCVILRLGKAALWQSLCFALSIEESPNIAEQGAEQGSASALHKFRRAGAILARQIAQQKADRLAQKAR